VSEPGADPIVVEIAEVKPLNKKGIKDGNWEVFKCYKDHVAKAGANCPSPTTDEEKEFCEDLGAWSSKEPDKPGKKVVLSQNVGLAWEPGKAISVREKKDSGPYHDVLALSCGKGLVGYYCPKTLEGEQQ
jgi:hypothetical protein